MEPLVSYRLDQAIATITLDDGKVNALSPTMQAQIAGALDQAEVIAAWAVCPLSAAKTENRACSDMMPRGLLRGACGIQHIHQDATI